MILLHRPKQCTCTTGKKKNSHVESRICETIPPQLSLGRRFSFEFVDDMAVELIFEPKVECGSKPLRLRVTIFSTVVLDSSKCHEED